MATSPRFAELNTPQGLLNKLRHDLKRMEQSSSDLYAAFDFFVTADSMVDWICPDEAGANGKLTRDKGKERKAIRESNGLLRIVAHLANGAKHFTVTKHNSVDGIDKDRYVEKGYVDDGYIDEPLSLHLTLDEQSKSGLGSTIQALDLARDIVKLWAGDPRVV